MAATLEQQLDALIADHRLSSINIARQPGGVSGPFTCITISSVDGHFSVTTQGTPSEQIAKCLAEIAAKRLHPVGVPELEAL